MPSFARTKIQRPRARVGTLLPRPALQARLVEALTQRALVLLCATAGYGKTSLLQQALDALPTNTAVAWIGCDEGDSPLQLFACLVAALEPFDLPWRIAPDALIAAAAGGSDAGANARARKQMVAELINALDACEVPHGVIVVDDLHRIDHPEVFQFIDALLERFTPRWTLVLATRTEPPIALARLRVRHEVEELRGDDLRFGAPEAQALAARVGLEASAAEPLLARTAGWPAGLQLALNALAQRPRAKPSGSPTAPDAVIDRAVFDFLAAEVLDQLPAALREFLLATCVLPELTAARCAALTGDARAAEHLEAIERADLFVTTLPEPEPTLRLHDLFRDALEHRLRRERPEALRPLLERAARTEPDAATRLNFLLRAEAWAEAARELREQAPALLTASQTAAVERALARFPAGLANTLPDLLTVQVLLAWMQWRWDAMQRHALAAAAAYRQQGRTLDALAAQAYAALALETGSIADSTATGAEQDPSAHPAQMAEVGAAVDALLAERVAQMRSGQRWESHEPGMVAALIHRMSIVLAHYGARRADAMAPAYERVLDLLAHTHGADAVFQTIPSPGYIGLPGMRRALLRFVQLAQERLGDEPSHLRMIVQAIEGGAQLWAGEVARGRELLREAAAEARWYDFPVRGVIYAHTFLCVADAITGDSEALRADARMLAAALDRADPGPNGEVRLAGERFRLARWLHAGGLHDEAAAVWQKLLANDDPRMRTQWAPVLRMCKALLAWTQHEDTARGEREALDTLTALLNAPDPGLEPLGLGTELRLRTAALALAHGASARDVAPWVRTVLDRHAHDADLAPVLLAGPQVLHALAETPARGQWSAEDAARLKTWAQRADALRTAWGEDEVGAVSAASHRSALTGGTPDTTEPASTSRAPAAPQTSDAAAIRGQPLTAREVEILERLAAGDSNKLIARAFDLSPHTVKRHVANILDKLDLRSRGQAAAWFHSHRPS